MKKVLLILFVLAICVLAFPHGVMADATPDIVAVDANIKNVLTFSADGPGQLLLIRNQDNPFPTGLAFDVDSSSKWEIAVVESGTPPSPANPGHMKEWNGAYKDGGYFLSSAIAIQRDDESYQDLLAASQKLVESGVAGDIAPFTKGFAQYVDLADSTLTSSNYRIVLTFTCTQVL
jgi:hypothetical protein